MNSLNDPTIKIKYQKCKFRVKRWESDFMEKHGRRPSKNDIRSADISIKDAYKMYWNLKTQALEETLSDITFPDDVETNVSVNLSFDKSLPQEDIETGVNKCIHSTPPKNIENIVPEKSPLKSDTVVTPPLKESCMNVDGAWGEHLNKDNIAAKKQDRLSISRSSSFQLSQNKFTSSTFSKRNPRKSLSTSRIKSKSDLRKSSNQVESSCDTKSEENVNNIQSLLGESMKVTHQDVKIIAQPLNPIQQLINGGLIAVERSINAGWLDRCTKDLDSITSNQQRLSGVSDSGVESMDLSDHSPPVKTIMNKENSLEFSDEDDFVCNSDTEEESRSKRIRNWHKSLSDVSNQTTKRLCIENISENNATPLRNHLPVNVTVVPDNTKNNYIPECVQYIRNKTIELSENTEVENVETKTNCKPIVPVEQGVKRKRSMGKLKVDTSDIETDKCKRRKSRVTGYVRTRKQASGRRVTKKSCIKSIETEDEEATLKIQDGPEIPIYGVESLEVVPRFFMPADAQNDLIEQFCQSASDDASKAASKPSTKPKSAMTAKEKLEAKVTAGSVNENFVRINLKKKIFARGKRSFNFSRYKKNEWKQKKKGLGSSEGSLDLADLAEKNTCFKCGGSGHIGKKCPALKSDELLPLDKDEPSDYPTLEEAAKMASQEPIQAHCHRIDRLPECPSFASTTREKPVNNLEAEHENIETLNDVVFDEEIDVVAKPPLVGHKIPQDLVDKLLPPVNGKIDPLYPVAADGSAIETPIEVFEALKMFGHESFRPGQEKAVMRILTGQSTLVTLSTGSGKSLCYQLPAYLYAKRSHCITLVISPLVSLMDDQVTGIPDFLSAAALHTGQTPNVRAKIMDAVRNGKLDILLISPEAVAAGEKSTGFGSLLRQLPPIAFVCIDEAHCISQWSHNFRPSYLMICRVLMEKMRVKTILGLTATATISTAESIVSYLRIHDGLNGVISDTPLPKNLILTVSKDEQRDRALINLLKSKRFEQCDSIIIYCTRRDECTRIAGLLRVSLQDTSNTSISKPNTKVSPIAEPYHAGLPASRRKAIQKAFMRGHTRIVVATVAFGMGINKSNIRSVIHYNMPSNFEGYVQEVGRAGRDNLPAHCHLFLSPTEDSDKWELRRHINADGVDRHIIRRLLQKIFVPCSCAVSGRKCPGHEVAIPIDETVRALDVSEEIISTLLCYLELHCKKFVTVLSPVYVNAKVSSYNGPKVLKIAAQSSPPLAMAIALDKKNETHHENSVIEFPVIDVAAAVGWDSGVVKSHLKNLEWEPLNGKYKRTAISVRYDTLGLRVRAPGDLTDAELDEALDALFERSRSQQTSALQQLDAIHASLNKFSHPSVRDCMELNDESVKKSEDLKKSIRQYFQSTSTSSIIHIPAEACNKSNGDQIVNDIRSLLCSYRDVSFTGRAVARIFHGIQSPNYSAITWSRCRFWRGHLPVDFDWIVQMATREILSMR